MGGDVDVEKLLNSADIDGDGKITFYEFVKANSRGIFKTKLSKAQSE
jgi:Ca2+-binding EF-hand superfamily protein